MKSKALSTQNSFDVKKFPRALKLGPLSYGEWDLEFISFFMSFPKQNYGEGATRMIQGSGHYLIDQFLTVEQADLDACYEANKDKGFKKIKEWGKTLVAFFEMFNKHAAKNLKVNPEELKPFTYSFVGVRSAQAAISMRGEVPAHVVETLNHPQWLGSPQINVKLFQ